MSHVNALLCPSCATKLQTAHPDLIAFATVFRSANHDAHISCSSRTEAEQEADFAKGVSKAKWRQSPHDFTPALALDWFRLTQAGGASFDSVWYTNVLAPAAKAAGLTWGGCGTNGWENIRDLPHVQLSNWKTLA